MNISLAVKLKTEPNKEGLYAVRFRITSNRITKYINTGVFVPMENWNEAGTIDKENWIVQPSREKKNPLFKIYNEDIKDDLIWLKALIQTNRHWSAEQVKAAFEQWVKHKQDPNLPAYGESKPTCFIQYARLNIQQRSVSPDTVDLYFYTLNKVTAYLNKKPLPFSKLDYKFVQAYKKYLTEKLENKSGTIKTNFTILSDFAARAVKERLLDKNPFDEIDYTAKGTTKKARPSQQQVQALAVQASDTGQLTAVEENALLIFFMQYYCHGARIRDMLELKWENVTKGRIEYTMGKSHKFKTIKRNEQLDKILDHYRGQQSIFIFPYLKDAVFKQYEVGELTEKQWKDKRIVAIITINRGLKMIAQRVGMVGKLTSHMARHSFADALLRKTRDPFKIKEFLGHSSVQTSEIYIEQLSLEELDNVADDVYQE